MKTIDQLNDQIDSIKEGLDGEDVTPAQKKAAGKKIVFLRTCIMYLESGPKDDFVKKEIERVQNRMTAVNGYFPYDKYKDLKIRNKELREHNKLHGISLLKSQLKNLKFILK